MLTYTTSKGRTVEIEMAEVGTDRQFVVRLPSGRPLSTYTLRGPFFFEHYQVKQAIGFLCIEADRAIDQ